MTGQGDHRWVTTDDSSSLGHLVFTLDLLLFGSTGAIPWAIGITGMKGLDPFRPGTLTKAALAVTCMAMGAPGADGGLDGDRFGLGL